MTDRVRVVPTVSPFQRLTQTLAGIVPGKPPISLAVGEPQHPVPDFVAPVIAASIADFGRYPANPGTEAFRSAVADWLGWRYGMPGAVDPARMVLVVNGSREGLFLAALTARERYADKERPAVLLPNPFYQAYAAGADTAGAERIVLECPAENDYLPDFSRLAPEVLDRTIAAYVCSPANPQGGVASLEKWKAIVALARRHRFMLFADECYSELYRKTPPPGALQAAHALGSFDNVVVFHSLSKRSNLPGLRCGFAAGDPDFLAAWTRLRAIAGPQVSMPLQAVAVAAYRDEAHVAANRALYNQKYEAAETILGGRFGYYTPEGGFFLWLDMSAVGGGEAAAVRLWREAGVRTIPGGYLALPGPDGRNPADPFLRLAMVQDLATTKEALHRLAALFD